jgi:uncharacterized metal-binding protein YceD (DUF177 family)
VTPEFSRTERVDTVGDRPRKVAIEADAGERDGLARRFGLLSIERLAATFTLTRDAAGIVVEGRVTGELTQPCAGSGEPLAARVDEAVTLRFVEEDVADEDVELAEDALDTLPIEDGRIDLGEAAAETLALAIDPFARRPDADAAMRAAGVRSEDEVDEEANPFGALAELKRKLEE